jgi:hypothetical protein
MRVVKILFDARPDSHKNFMLFEENYWGETLNGKLFDPLLFLQDRDNPLKRYLNRELEGE